MIVIADTTPLNYLVLIGHQEVLGRMFGQVLIPPAVYTELQAEQTPAPVKEWLRTMPAWLEVRPAQLPADSALLRLDAGEREAILLAQETNADLLLLDERAGRREAKL